MPVNYNNTDEYICAPFRGITPISQQASEIAAPPYDVLSSEEARELAKDNPFSFLHISKAEIDFAPSTSPYEEKVYQKAAENFNAMIKNGTLIQARLPHFYIYRLQGHGQTQTGIVVAAACKAYKDGRIKRHELTRTKKENDRVKQIKSVGAQTGPALLIQKRMPVFQAFLNRITSETPPMFSFMDANHVRHTLWVNEDPVKDAIIADFFAYQNQAYIADGHHRTAAAVRIAEENNTLDTARFLAVVFFENELKIMDYNRVVHDLNNLTAQEFLEKITAAGYTVTPTQTPKPTNKGEFGLYLDKTWYRLTPAVRQDETDPVKKLDVSILSDKILDKILNITDLRNSPRIEFVGGIRGNKEIERLVDAAPNRAGFMLFPPSVEELIAVADHNMLMPPKSTWFEPKLADGVISYKEENK